MPTFGICGPLTLAPAAKAAGWDYLEGSVRELFQGDTPDDAWTGLAAVRSSALPVLAANLFLPADLKVVGPGVDEARIETYLSRVFPRAAACGTQTIVFGSGGARQVPEGFDRATARDQIVAFSGHVARHAGRAGVTVVFEPLNRGECNILNSVAEGMEYVHAVNQPSVKCLVDSYHFWLEKEPLSSLAEAMGSITHVHVADEHGRETPGVTGKSDYRAFFRTLKAGGYDGRISVEAPPFNASQFASCLAFLKGEWAAV